MELRSGKTLSKFSKKNRLLNNSSSAAVTEEEELNMPLPEDLVERVLAMVPFPQIFKARALSKSWQARFSSSSSHDDEEKKLLAASFQKRVCEWSVKWNTSCPIYLFHDFLIAYDRASRHWRKIPTLSVLPDREVMKVNAHMTPEDLWGWSMVGALLFVKGGAQGTMLVVNIFTGSWRQLPPLPTMVCRSGTQRRLVSSKEMYKVIRLYEANGCASACIYDSKFGAWRTKKVDLRKVLQDFKLGWFDVYLNGVLYVIVCFQGMLWGFLAFDVEDETFNLLQMPTADISEVEHVRFLHLVACNDTVYIVVLKHSRTVVLLEADLGLRKWSKVIRSPPAAVNFGPLLGFPSSAGDCVLFEGCTRIGRSNGKVLAYNVRKDEWSYFTVDQILKQYLPMPCHFNASFEPGRNLFLEV